MTDQAIRVVVNGALGRMGQTVLGAVKADRATNPVGGADRAASTDTVAVNGGDPVALTRSLADLLAAVDADVVVDFSSGEGAVQAMEAATGAGVRVVSGSTGVPAGELERLGAIAAERGVGIISASNFALGAVLMMYLAEVAGPHFDYADLIESHHEAKIDSPSGTALSIAASARAGRDTDFSYNEPEKVTLDGLRGGWLGGVNVLSARVPGRMQWLASVFGLAGHSSASSSARLTPYRYMPGVMAAVKRVMSLTGLMVGLDQVLGLRNPAKP